MDHTFLSFNAVEYFYPSSVEPVLKNISFDLHRGWTGIVGVNGAGKTTLLLLAAGLLQPSAGIIKPDIKKSDDVLYCPQRTDELPKGWEDFFSSADNETGALCGRLRIEYDWPYRWDSLSHGERKRLQLAIALSRNPAALAVDEPTNHLDQEAKTLIADALAGYTGIGLLVSHDRSLLDRLCNNCLFLETGSALLRPGGVSQGMAEADREQMEQGRVREQIQSERKRLATEADKRRRDVEGARNRLSKKNTGAKDSNARAKIYLAKLTGKDAVGANLYRRMETRIGRLDRELDAQGRTGNIQAKRKTGLTMESAASKADKIFLLEPGSIVLGEGAARDHSLSFPELTMGALDRVALTGPNGSGKSTLIARILENIPPSIPLFYLPQELTEEESRAVLDQIYEEDEKSRGEILSRFSRLGSDPGNILQSALPSPGEVRKLLIARAVFHNPAFIVMDEPTNHLDLKSVLLLEEMLRECRCALLLVSHDEAFLSALTNKEWAIVHGSLTL
ncbi:ABC transporter ATP-binding protein [Spirochaetia bacterium]|nr:ABC transporter ATP-binding protein [Spirochaetia bacterium]